MLHRAYRKVSGFRKANKRNKLYSALLDLCFLFIIINRFLFNSVTCGKYFYDSGASNNGCRTMIRRSIITRLVQGWRSRDKSRSRDLNFKVSVSRLGEKFGSRSRNK